MPAIPDHRQHKVSRRGFLIALTGSALAVTAGCRPEGVVAPTPYVPGSGTRVPNTPVSPSAGSAATSVATGVAQKDPTFGTITYDKLFLTKVDDLYVTQYDYNNTPNIDITTWSVKIDGSVETPLTLNYDAIKAFPSFQDTRTLECIGNPVGGNLIGNIQWTGFAFDEILKAVKPKATATHLKFECADGYSTSVELKWVTQPGTMIAYLMNGQPLNTVHGFPIRILTPGLYGQKMPRWITHLQFIDADYIGFWESNGWSNIASVQTNSMIQTPRDGYGAHVATTLAIQGVAWAGTRKIMKVEVQIDKDDWMPATIVQGDSPLQWTQWYLTWTPTAPGNYQIGVRATDDTGFVQSVEANGIFGDSAPDGTNAIHRISVQVA